MLLLLTLSSVLGLPMIFVFADMHTPLPIPRLSPEQSGIVMVVVYFVTAFWVAMIWNIPHHASSFHVSSLGVGMCGGIFSVYPLSRVKEIAYVPAANFVS